MVKGWNEEAEKIPVRKAVRRTGCTIAVLLFFAYLGTQKQLVVAGTLGRAVFNDKQTETTVAYTQAQTEGDTINEESSVPANAEEFIFWDSDSRYLTEEEVMACSADDLARARNELYARRGRVYVGGKWEVYFSSKSWYRGTIPAEEFDENNIFNDFEKKNRDLIVRIEREK